MSDIETARQAYVERRLGNDMPFGYWEHKTPGHTGRITHYEMYSGYYYNWSPVEAEIRDCCISAWDNHEDLLLHCFSAEHMACKHGVKPEEVREADVAVRLMLDLNVNNWETNWVSKKIFVKFIERKRKCVKVD